MRISVITRITQDEIGRELDSRNPQYKWRQLYTIVWISGIPVDGFSTIESSKQ